jgi:hypothetical protein
MRKIAESAATSAVALLRDDQVKQLRRRAAGLADTTGRASMIGG